MTNLRTIHPTDLDSETACDSDWTSGEFRSTNKSGKFTLDISINEGAEGDQNLVGVLYLRHRNALDKPMVPVAVSPFSAVAGVDWRHVEEFEGGSATLYDLFFDRTSGTGDIVASFSE
jgi:hypothetical protein